MAYCLISLVEILEHILYPENHHRNWVLDYDDKPQIQSLLETTISLIDALEDAPPASQAVIEGLEDRIRQVAENAEDVLETHISDLILSTRKNRSFIISPPSLEQIIGDVKTILEMITSPVVAPVVEAAEELVQVKDQLKVQPAATFGRTGTPEEGMHDSTNQTTDTAEDVNDKHVPESQIADQTLSSTHGQLQGSTESMVSPSDKSNTEAFLVGLQNGFDEVSSRLTGESRVLEIVPIVGMGGIGKTTLARRIYEEYRGRIRHFDQYAWATISQDYSVRNILLALLGQIVGKPTDAILQMKDHTLGHELYTALLNSRYLIVLDDIWSTKALDDVICYFPDDQKRSRIIITTRGSDVATHAHPNGPHHEMHLLGEVDSWTLFTQLVWGDQKTFPPDLEKVGRKITDACAGLPLAIEVICGLLSQVERSRESWEHVRDNVSSFIANANEKFSGIFSLSYAYLPHHVKACFLYMCAFPEDYGIRASKLIRLWVAEGFLKPIQKKSQEAAAEAYLQILEDRRLIFVRERKNNGKVKSYGLHDILKDLSLEMAHNKKFLYVKKKVPRKETPHEKLPENTLCLRRVSVHPSYHIVDVYASKELMPLTRSFLCTGNVSKEILSPVFFPSRLLRVLDVLGVKFHEFPQELLQLVNLRYLAFTSSSELPDISRLRNLQALIFQLESSFEFHCITNEILNMTQLRHIKFMGGIPTFVFVAKKSNVLQEKLESLSTISVSDLVKVLEGIPNLKKLGVHCYGSSPVVNLGAFTNKLETLTCSSKMSPSSKDFLSNLTFPPSVKKLTLSKCFVPEACMEQISKLPNLEILKLQESDLENSTWEPSEEEEFCNLLFLLIEKLNLESWVVDDETQFPKLRQLVIRDCSKLDEIPLEIGRFSKVEIIEVYGCDSSASVENLQKELRRYGNSLQVQY